MSAHLLTSAGSPQPMIANGSSRFRSALLIYATVLASTGTWLLVADILRPRAAGPLPAPSNPFLGAQVGIFRGDLWANAAVVEARTLPWPERSAAVERGAVKRFDQVRTAMETSLTLAPINAEGWLFLAKLPSASGTADPRVARLLEMAYFTAPNAVTLAPRRLERATTSNALSDPAIQDLVKMDIRRLLAAAPQAKGILVTTYQNALPENRTLFESLVAEIDPTFARGLRSAQPK
jgi:hypothetical protein